MRFSEPEMWPPNNRSNQLCRQTHSSAGLGPRMWAEGHLGSRESLDLGECWDVSIPAASPRGCCSNGWSASRTVSQPWWWLIVDGLHYIWQRRVGGHGRGLPAEFRPCRARWPRQLLWCGQSPDGHTAPEGACLSYWSLGPGVPASMLSLSLP